MSVVVRVRLSLRRSIRLRHSMSRRFDSRVSKKVSGFDPISFRTHDSGSYVVSNDVEFDTIAAKSESDMFEFYHAKSREQRYQGLSGRKSLATDGMLFEYPSVKKHRLVFRDMHFPLDVLFLDEDGNIVDRGELDEDNQRTESVCLYALEVEKGWIQQNDISLTDSFDISRSLNKQWEPYVGPQEGFGWTDGEDVVYQEEPPGEVDLSNLTDEQVEQLEEELGQSFSDDSSDVDQQEVYERDIEDSIDMDNLESTDMLSKDDVVNVLSSNMTRVKQSELADNTISKIESISSNSPVSSWQGSSGRMRLSDNAYERTVSHESAHAFVNANGFDTSMFATLVSNAFDRDTGFDDTIIGKSKGEVIDEAESDGNINPGLADQFRDVIDQDDTVEVSDLTFSEMDDFDGSTNEELSALVNSISETFEELVKEMKYEGDPIESLTQDRPDTIKDEYEWTNANEFFAAIHENLQQEGINRNNLEVMYEQYPEVLSSYFDVFEPNELQKRELNQLFNDSGGSGPIESLPFPEFDND